MSPILDRCRRVPLVARAASKLRVGALAGVFVLGASTAEAQMRSTVHFAPGGPAQAGYSSASVDVLYNFQACDGQVWVVMNYDPSSFRTSSTYWYEGKEHPVPAGSSTRMPIHVRFSGDVMRPGAQIGRVDYPTGRESSGGHCAAAVNRQSIARFSDLLGGSRTIEQERQLIASLSIPQPSVGGEKVLTNGGIEDRLRTAEREAAQAEREKLRAAEQAQRDQERAAQQQAAAEEQAGRQAQQPAAPPQRRVPQTAAEDPAVQERRAQEQRAREVAAAQRQFAENVARAAAEQEQAARQVAAASATIRTIGGMLEQTRAENEERKRRKEEAEAAALLARKCPPVAIGSGEALRLGSTVTGTVRPGIGCIKDIESPQFAVLTYTLTVAEPQWVEIQASETSRKNGNVSPLAVQVYSAPTHGTTYRGRTVVRLQPGTYALLIGVWTYAEQLGDTFTLDVKPTHARSEVNCSAPAVIEVGDSRTDLMGCGHPSSLHRVYVFRVAKTLTLVASTDATFRPSIGMLDSTRVKVLNASNTTSLEHTFTPGVYHLVINGNSAVHGDEFTLSLRESALPATFPRFGGSLAVGYYAADSASPEPAAELAGDGARFSPSSGWIHLSLKVDAPAASRGRKAKLECKLRSAGQYDSRYAEATLELKPGAQTGVATLGFAASSGQWATGHYLVECWDSTDKNHRYQVLYRGSFEIVETAAENPTALPR